MEGRKIKLTSLQKKLRQKYIEIIGTRVNLVVVDDRTYQGFNLDYEPDTLAEANWMADMLAIALGRMLKAEMSDSLELNRRGNATRKRSNEG
jgi:hypothetical protein